MANHSTCFYLIILLFSLSFAHALEVSHRYQFYSIDPTIVRDISREIDEKGPKIDESEERVIALYRPKIHFYRAMNYQQLEDHCDIQFRKPRLSGIIEIYRLHPGKTYSDAIVKEVEKRFNKTKIHELTHEKIYKEGLERAEMRVRSLIQYESFRYCVDPIRKISSIYDNEFEEIRLKNLQFDCNEYGFGGLYGMCKPIARDEVTQAKPEEACDGELVEAFKGKFYCVKGSYLRP